MKISDVSQPHFEFDLVVVGLGYVGMPLLQAARGAGLNAIGYDTSPLRVSKINESYRVNGAENDSTPPEFDSEEVQLATTDSSVISRGRYIAVCVPTPTGIGHKPDLSFVISATSTIASNLRPRQTVILESTVSPGTTDGPVRELLENISGLSAEFDFHLAFSPERIDPGNTHFDISNTPKVIGGLFQCCTEAAESLYSQFVVETTRAKGCREAEAAKLLENSYRHINIAFINEFATACMSLGINIFDVIRMAETKPFGFKSFTPSVGAGGHCIPVDPNYFGSAYFEKTGKSLEFLNAANEINDRMPSLFVDMSLRALSEMNIPAADATVLVLGLSYKANVGDMRESPGAKMAADLADYVGKLKVHDPCVEWGHLNSDFDEVVADNEFSAALASSDLIIILQPHDFYLLHRAYIQSFGDKIVSPLDPSIFGNSFGFAGK